MRKISSDPFLNYQCITPQLKDLELVNLILTTEYMGIESENHLFRNLPDLLKTKIERSFYNRRKRKLAFAINEIWLKLAQQLNEFEDCLSVDSIQLEIYKIARVPRSKICKKQNYCFYNRWFCVSQQMPFYGYKLHSVCAMSRVFQSIYLSPASVHNIHYLTDIKSQLLDYVQLEEKGYFSSEIHIDLFNRQTLN